MAAYYVWSAAAGSANGTSWTNAYTTLATALSGKAAGDVFYLAHDHAETTAGSITLSAPGTAANPAKVVCVDRSGSVPPVSADRRATAQVATSGTLSHITINGQVFYDGVIFAAGLTSGNSNELQIAMQNSVRQRFDNCSLRLPFANNGTFWFGGGNFGGNIVELNNTTVSFGNAFIGLTVYCTLKWRNTPSALLGTVQNGLFSPQASRGASIECIGVDFSAMGSGKTICGTQSSQAVRFQFIDCKLNAAVTKSTVPTSPGAPEVDFIRSGSAGVNYTIHRERMQGVLTEETTIVRTGGASDGTTPISWKVITTSNCSYAMPFECAPIAIWNDTTGSAVTATVECIAAALPNDDEVWLDVEYLGDASSPQGSFVNDGKADLLATAANQTSSSETWGGSTAAFKLAVTFTAQQKGWVYGRIKIGKASSTLYIDPLVTLS